MTLNVVPFFADIWYSQKVQAGLEPHVLSVLCVGVGVCVSEIHWGFLMLLLCLTRDERSVM